MSERWHGVPEEDAVRKLLGDAGPRPPLPEEDLGAIRDAARGQWRRRYGAAPGRKSPRRWWLPLAAALLAGVIGLAWWARSRPSVSAPTVAFIERVSGAGLEVGSALAAGSMLATGGETPGRLTLRMRGGASVRLDLATQVRLESATMVEILRGAVYVDTGAAPGRAEEIAVRAGNDLFHPAGTQFQVRVEGRETQLRVREGRVAMDRRDGSVVAGVGEELIARSDGGVIRRQVALSGPEWDWVGETAPMLAIEGVKVREFLNWIGRERGLRIELAYGEAADIANSCILHGSIDHLTLADAPRVVLSSCGLSHRISNGTLVVFVAGKKGG